jgi:flagellar basal-body rod modification protein FlgD
MTTVGASGLGQSSAEISENYLGMLVTQLQNQNPLDPMDTNQMASQLSSLAQLGKLEAIDGNFNKLLVLSHMGQGTNLIGKDIAFVPRGEDEPVAATVSSVEIEGEDVFLQAGTHRVALNDILAVR